MPDTTTPLASSTIIPPDSLVRIPPDLAVAASIPVRDTDSDSDFDSYDSDDEEDSTFKMTELILNLVKSAVDFSEDDAQFVGMDPAEARVRAMEVANALTDSETDMFDVDVSVAPARLVLEALMDLFEHQKRRMKQWQEAAREVKRFQKMLDEISLSIEEEKLNEHEKEDGA